MTGERPVGLDRYEFRPLSDGSGVRISQGELNVIQIGWAAAPDLAGALLEAWRRHRIVGHEGSAQ